MKSGIRVQVPDEVVCVSLCANARMKGMNPSVLSPPPQLVGKELKKEIKRQTGFFSLGEATSLGKRKTMNSKPTLLRRKIDLVPHPARGGGVGEIQTRYFTVCTSVLRLYILLSFSCFFFLLDGYILPYHCLCIRLCVYAHA